MSPDITRVLTAYDALVADAVALVAPLSDAQVNFRLTGWSIGQNLDHLVRANASYLSGMSPAIARARAEGRSGTGALTPGVAGRLFVSRLEPPPPMRVKAPRSIEPASQFVAVDVLQAFRNSFGEARQLLAGAADLDLNAARFRNPFLPIVRVRVSTAFLILAAHGRRHLWQARQVLDADGFPR